MLTGRCPVTAQAPTPTPTPAALLLQVAFTWQMQVGIDVMLENNPISSCPVKGTGWSHPLQTVAHTSTSRRQILPEELYQQ